MVDWTEARGEEALPDLESGEEGRAAAGFALAVDNETAVWSVSMV
jgi:hypothetical protein